MVFGVTVVVYFVLNPFVAKIWYSIGLLWILLIYDTRVEDGTTGKQMNIMYNKIM